MVLIACSFIFGPLRSVTLGLRIITGVLVGLVFRYGQDAAGFASLLMQPLAVAVVGGLMSSMLLTLVLVLAILDIFGIKTTSFAALLAGAGLAIGAAWSGMLGNFAAGLFLQVLRPYKVGDFISAGGTLGTVKELGLFATTILTPDNVMTVVGNNKVFGDNIQNFSTEPFRRVDCVAKVANSVDVQDAIARLRPAIAAIANVKDAPAPDIEILQFTPEGPLLCVRPYTHTDHYWQVYFDTHKAIVATFGAAGYPVPETPMAHRTVG